MWRPDAACSCADVALCKRAACHYRRAPPAAPLRRLHPISPPLALSKTSSHSSAGGYEACGTRAAFLMADARQKCIKFPIWNPSLGVCWKIEARWQKKSRRVCMCVCVQSVWGCRRNSIYTRFGSCGIPAVPPGRSYKMPAQRLTSFSISHLTIHGAQGCDRAASGERRDKNSTSPDLRTHCGSRRDGLKAPWGFGGSNGGVPAEGQRCKQMSFSSFFLPLLFLCLVQVKSLARGARSQR